MGQVYALYKSKKRERADRRRLVFFFFNKLLTFLSEISPNSLTWLFWVLCFFWYLLSRAQYHYFSHFMFSANPDCCMQVLRKPISEKTNRKRINSHLLFETDTELCSRHYVFFVVIPYHRTYTYTNGSFHYLGNKWSKLRLNYALPKAAC